MAPLAESYSTFETRTLREEVLKAHADYDAIYPKLEGWIAKQPAYLTAAYQRVYTDGNAQEVIDLVERYKTANGVGAQVPGTTTPKPGQKPASDENKANAAASLAPVSGKRTTPTPTGDDPNDFDGAFAEAAAQYSK
jgi:hypothetical protein